MSEAKQLYDDILSALSPILPRTVYQDVRRVRTLAWAITGLCLSQNVRLSGWAEVVKPPDSERRTPDPSLLALAASSEHCSCPMVSACDPGGALWLACGPASLYCAFLRLPSRPSWLFRACLVYRGRAIPLAWRAMRHRSTQVSFDAYQPVLNQVCAIMPAGQVITLRGSSRLCA